MIQEASVAGVLKTALILIGALVLLRFLGRVMIAKRNLDEERQMLDRERKFQRERSEKLRDFGKVTVSGKQTRGKTTDAEDVDFEEIN
jgi:hypothetical protein